MKTKEAIFFVKAKYDLEYNQENNADRNKLSEVIELLERGEKFEQMWEDLKFELAPPDDKPEDPSDDWVLIYSTIAELEQKYLPKEAKN